MRDRDPGPGDDEGHAQRGLVDEEPVRQLAVIAEGLAVIPRRDHDQAAAGAGLRGGDDAAQTGVGGGNLAVVGAPGLLLAVGRGRIVGRVRLVEMHPGEEGAVLSGDPFLGGGGDDRARPLGLQHARAGGAALDAVVVDIESTPETEAPIEDVGGDEGGRRITAALEQRGQGRTVRGKDRAAVRVQTVMRRLQAAQQRRVRRQGQGHGGEGLVEHGPPRGQRVQVGRGPRLRAVGPDVVRAQGVDRDEQDARAFDDARPTRPEDGDGDQRDRGQGAQKDEDRPAPAHGSACSRACARSRVTASSSAAVYSRRAVSTSPLTRATSPRL